MKGRAVHILLIQGATKITQDNKELISVHKPLITLDGGNIRNKKFHCLNMKPLACRMSSVLTQKISSLVCFVQLTLPPGLL